MIRDITLYAYLIAVLVMLAGVVCWVWRKGK